MADLFHCDKDEVVFGQNMTTITYAISPRHRPRTEAR